MSFRTTIFLFLVVWLLGLGAYPLLESTEGRYASVATTMVETGNWVEPSYNDAPLFSKPPLAYWTGAVAISLHPHSEAAVRLVSSMWWLLCALLTARLARVGGLSREQARWAGILAALSPLAVAQGHMNTGDIHLWAGLLLVYLGLLDEDRGRWVRPLLIGCGWAIGFLAKGHMVFFWTLIPPLAMKLVARGRGPRLRPLVHPLAWVIFLLLAAPWFIVVIGRHPDLVAYWTGDETVGRVASNLHGRSEPWWYFLPQLPLLMLPWLPELVRGLRGSVRAGEHRWLWWFWVAAPLLVFTLSSSKRPNYLLPMITPVAILAAGAVGKGRPWALVTRTTVWAILVLAFPFVMGGFDLAPPTRELARRAGEEDAPLICFDLDPTALAFYRGAPAPIFDRDPHNPFALRLEPEQEQAELESRVREGALAIVRTRDAERLASRIGGQVEVLMEDRGIELVRPRLDP